MPKYFIGVDGGGTKCRMRLTDTDLNILAEAVTDKPSNLQVRSGDAAFEAIADLIAGVFDKAGLDRSESHHAAACFGMAGARMKSARLAFQQRDFPLENVIVFDDIDIARAGAHGENDGGVMIIGTGSAAMALVNGKRIQSGGWGFFVGDTMSGAILGREMLRRSLLAFDDLEKKTPLTEAVMAKFDNDADKLMAWSFDNDKARGVKSIAIVGGLGHSIMKHIKARFGDIIVEEEPVSLNGAIILARQNFGG